MFAFIYLSVLALSGASLAHPQTRNGAIRDYFVHPNERSDGLIQGRIIGGDQAQPHAYPYQVGFYANTVAGRSFCGGSLVSRNYVLTAAHCVDNAVSVDLIFGAQVIDQNESSQIKQSSQEFIIHSGWDRNQLINDIALIKLSQPIVENNDIKIIKVANGVSTYVGDNGIVTGWGKTSNNQDGVSSVLRYVISNVLSNDACKNIDPYAGVIQPTHLCVSGSTTRGNVGTCNGDSGGPLASNGILIGVTSFGYTDCEAGKPSVFTRLTDYKEWIRVNSDVDV